MDIKVRDLKASDFPGIDEAKFNKWKALRLKVNREFWIGAVIFVAAWILVASLGYTGNIHFEMILLPLFLVFAVYNTIRNFRMGNLGRELKMKERLRARKMDLEYRE